MTQTDRDTLRWFGASQFLKRGKTAKHGIALVQRLGDRINSSAPVDAPTQQIDARNDVGCPDVDGPVLITTVDAEESFDWNAPFSRSAINLSAMTHQQRAHDIFVRYGVMPHYLVDYPVASQSYGRDPLREMLADGLCTVGAQLHPWVNPPFDEHLSVHNSYPGNLELGLEREKLKILTELIEDGFAVKPRIYRAGRYGFGTNTAVLLKEFGYRVDSSMVPGWSFAAQGGPDYSMMTSKPFWLDPEHTLLEIPISAALVGRAAQLNPAISRHLFNGISERFKIPAIMARANLLERIKLTPEGTTIDEAKRLVREMIARGCKVFTLTYHSPSLEPGNTPYVKTSDDLQRFLAWLDEFFDFFISEIRGRPTTWEEVHASVSAGRLSSKELDSAASLNQDACQRALIGQSGEGAVASNQSRPTTLLERHAAEWQNAHAAEWQNAGVSADLLFIAFYYPPENAIGGERPHRMARYMMLAGQPVTVIAANPPGLPESGAEVIRVPEPGRANWKVRLGMGFGWAIERFIMPYADRLSWVAPAYVGAVALMKKRPYHAVLSSHPPVATHLVALLLKWRYGVPWIADFRDPLWGDAYRTAKRAAILDPLLERLIFRSADAIIANTDSVAELWRKRYPRWSHKVHLIWNGFDPEDEFAPLPISKRQQRLIVHAGTLYGPRTPDILLQSLDRLLSHSGQIAPEAFQVRLIGPIKNGSADRSRSYVRRLMEGGCLCIEDSLVPKATARREVREADYLLLLDMTRGDNAGRQLPAKIFDYIRACRPIIAFTARGSATERVLARAGCRHVCIDPDARPMEIDAQLVSFLGAPLDETKPAPKFWQDFDARNQVAELRSIILSFGLRRRGQAGRTTG